MNKTQNYNDIFLLSNTINIRLKQYSTLSLQQRYMFIEKETRTKPTYIITKFKKYMNHLLLTVSFTVILLKETLVFTNHNIHLVE